MSIIPRSAPAQQPLLNADDVLRQCHSGDTILYLWCGEKRTGTVAGWRRTGIGKHQHMMLVYRSEMSDREIPLINVIALVL